MGTIAIKLIVISGFLMTPLQYVYVRMMIDGCTIPTFVRNRSLFAHIVVSVCCTSFGVFYRRLSTSNCLYFQNKMGNLPIAHLPLRSASNDCMHDVVLALFSLASDLPFDDLSVFF